MNRLSELEIKNNLHTDIVGNRFEIFDSIDSTNTYLKKIDKTLLDEGFTVLAENQTGGKGRSGKSFYAPNCTGIYMSMLFKPSIKLDDINIITVMAAVSVVDALKSKTGILVSIKWVNDIMYQNKKLCGILAESSIKSYSEWAEYIVLGIGVNVNETDFPDDIKEIATSLKQITNIEYDRNEIVAEILNCVDKNYKFISNTDGRKKIVDRYRENLNMLGKQIKIINGNDTYIAKALDVDENAELIVENENGQIYNINCGQISIRAF